MAVKDELEEPPAEYWSVQVWHGSIPFQEFSGR